MSTNITEYILDRLRLTESGETVRLTDLANETEEKTPLTLEHFNKIVKEARKERIYLEPAYKTFTETGLPYDMTYMVKRKADKAEFSKENCTRVLYNAGGYMCAQPETEADLSRRNTSDEVWQMLLHTVFDRCNVLNWYDTYCDNEILDGYYWNLCLEFKGGRKLTFCGSNDEPGKLKSLEKTIWEISKTAHYSNKEDKMDNDITEVVFILDASGSMYDLTSDTIGGFNSMLNEQRSKGGNVLVSTVTFNSKSHVIHDRMPISEISEMTEKDYVASGNTALIDAIGDAIHHISNVHKYIRKEDVPKNTLFIITTDGMENASRKYTSDEVKKMVETKKEIGWNFIFMGANIDSVETAAKVGISKDMAATYLNDSIGTKNKFKVAGNIINGMLVNACISPTWKADIEKDTEERQ